MHRADVMRVVLQLRLPVGLELLRSAAVAPCNLLHSYLAN